MGVSSYRKEIASLWLVGEGQGWGKNHILEGLHGPGMRAGSHKHYLPLKRNGRNLKLRYRHLKYPNTHDKRGRTFF